jgi:hypothetical protein
MYRRTILLTAGLLPLAAGCQSVDAQQTTTLNGVVETVDPVSRELLLRGAGGAQTGALLSVVVGPQVQRLDQIRSGDRVTVTYYQALAAQVVNVFSPQSQPFEGVTVDRRETADRPRGTCHPGPPRPRRDHRCRSGQRYDQLCGAQPSGAHRLAEESGRSAADSQPEGGRPGGRRL